MYHSFFNSLFIIPSCHLTTPLIFTTSVSFPPPQSWWPREEAEAAVALSPVAKDPLRIGRPESFFTFCLLQGQLSRKVRSSWKR